MIRILASEGQKTALIKNLPDAPGIAWVTNFQELVAEQAPVYMDLLFHPSAERQQRLLQRGAGAFVFIHSVVFTLGKLKLPFIRMNAWPGFLENTLLECTAPGHVGNEDLEQVGTLLDRKWVRVVDEPGFISARIVSMIINEAYLALEEAVSTKQEIDIAMKTGTNYPFGPFEWAEKIGLQNIVALLTELSAGDSRYLPASLLVHEAGNQPQTNS